jgi:tetratricopeptide (TPR) repeat protein
METNQKKLNLIERFFEFDLDEQELQTFQKELSDNPDFKQQVEQYRSIDRQIDQMLNVETKEQGLQKEWAKKLLDSQPAKSIALSGNTSRWLKRISAVLLLISLAASALFMLLRPTTDLPQVADQYWEAVPKTTSINNRNIAEGEDVIIQTTALMENEEYAAALELLSEPEPNNLLLLLQSEALLSLRQPKEAIEKLDIMLNQPEEGLVDVALYYSAIAYLYLDNKEKAVEALNVIIEEGYANEKEAEELLKDLK